MIRLEILKQHTSKFAAHIETGNGVGVNLRSIN